MASRFLIPLIMGVLPAVACGAAQPLFADSQLAGGDVALGQASYAQACALCHGTRLEGTPFGPTLVGQAFVRKWRGKPASELLTLMRATMPPRGAVPVDPGVFPHLLEFLVQANVRGVPASAPESPAASTAQARSGRVAEPQMARLTPELAQLLVGLRPVTEDMLAAPPDGAWLMWRRTPDSTGFSPLKQVDRGNVRGLREEWRLRLDPSGNEITPLVHDGVLFAYSGASIQAVDAASGRPLWKYTHRGGSGADRSRLKSIAIHGHALYMPTTDGHLLALDARSGRLLWDRSIRGDSSGGGLQFSSGPLVARGMVIIGASLGLTSKGGCFIVGLDAATGEERWRFNTIARPGSPGGDTWNGAPVAERFGAGVWTTGSYDPALDLVFFGVGNTYTTATLLEPRRGPDGVGANDGLFTNATLALRPRTGELVWYHQHHRRDVWDQDWAFEQTLLTLGSGDAARRVVVTGGKSGVFDALDAATGRFLFAQDTGLTNLFTAIDPGSGTKHTNPALEPVPGRMLLLCPGNLGGRNWPATSFNAATGMLFVPMTEACAGFTYEPRSRTETASGGSDIRFTPSLPPGNDGNLGRIMALDLATRSVRWMHRQRMPMAGSLLATAGGLVFAGDLGRSFAAFDQDSGERLWQAPLPAAAESNAITYAVDGRQYIAVVAGEASHLGTNHRRLVPELGSTNTNIELIVFALPRE